MINRPSNCCNTEGRKDMVMASTKLAFLLFFWGSIALTGFRVMYFLGVTSKQLDSDYGDGDHHDHEPHNIISGQEKALMLDGFKKGSPAGLLKAKKRAGKKTTALGRQQQGISANTDDEEEEEGVRYFDQKHYEKIINTKSYFETMKRVRKPMRRKMKADGPIFVLNLPKTGTKSIHKYFDCGVGEYWSSHHWMNNASGHKMRLGQCMGRNNYRNLPLIQGCGGAVAYADAGAIWDVDADDAPEGDNGVVEITGKTEDGKDLVYRHKCFYPGLHGLDNVARHYPNATIIHLYRNSKQWFDSAKGWLNILPRLSRNCEGFPKVGKKNQQAIDEKAWIEFYSSYVANIRQFAAQHPSLTYVEAELESPDVGLVLERAIGLPSSCFGHHHKSAEVGWLNKTKERIEHDRDEKQQQQLSSKLAADLANIKVPTPVFAVSLPRTVETFKLHKYLECGLGKGRSTHTHVQDLSKGDFVRVAECFAGNTAAGKPLGDSCGSSHFLAYTDAGGMWTDNTNKKQERCFYPGLHGLDNIATHYPNATLLHVRLSEENGVKNWVDTARSHANFLRRMSLSCGGSEVQMGISIPQVDASDQDWVDFYNDYGTKLRQFAAEHPSITLVEAAIDSPDFQATLQEAMTGMPEHCASHLPSPVPAKEEGSGDDSELATTVRSDLSPEILAKVKKGPIFVMNMPKTGTQSIHRYFECGWGLGSSSHHWMKNESSGCHQCRVGQCMARNHKLDRPLVEGCGGYKVYTDSGLVWYDEANLKDKCFYPGVHGLDNIAKNYPTATIVHIKRNTSEWVQSSRKWSNILGRMATFCDGFPRQKDVTDSKTEAGVSDERWAEWYDQYAENIRSFASNNPTMTYIEGELGSPKTEAILEEFTGISHKRCFQHHHKTADTIKAEKRRETGVLMIKRKPPKAKLSIPTPVFVMNVQASATSYAHQYFECGLGVGWSANHFLRNDTGHRGQIGECMYHNHVANRPLVEGCGGYASYVNAGAYWKKNHTRAADGKQMTTFKCFYPGIHGLDNIAEHYPNSTVMMLKYDTAKWLTGARRNKSLLMKISTFCKGAGGLPILKDMTAATEDDMWTKFYHGYLESIRDFSRKHPSLTYVEVEAESAETPSILEKATGLPANCYGHVSV